MSEKQRRRVRVITDPTKYRRHQLRKVARKLGKAALWVGAVVLSMLIIWYLLDVAFQVRPPP